MHDSPMAAIPQRVAKIPAATERLNILASELIECVDRLESRCIALLSPEGPSEATDNKMEGPPLACFIHEACDRLEAVKRRLNQLHNRIEL